MVSVVMSRLSWGAGLTKSPDPQTVVIQAACGETLDETTVPPSEGNEVRRDGL